MPGSELSTLLSGIGTLGLGGFLAYVIFKAYQKQTEALMGVIKANTEAYAKVCADTEKHATASAAAESELGDVLVTHDQRAVNIGQDVKANAQQLAAIHDDTQAIRKGVNSLVDKLADSR